MKNLFLLPALIAGLGAIAVDRATAQTFTILHAFHRDDNGIEEIRPSAGLILSGNALYGTTQGEDAPALDRGTVFAVNTDGTGFETLHYFSAYSTNSSGFYTNSDGFSPYAGLILSGNTLYGTAPNGGSSHNGTLFAVKTDGTGFTNLHSLDGDRDGGGPFARLILSDSTLYETASWGGSSGRGTVFAVNTDGTGFMNLHSFDGGRDGGSPVAGLILSGNTLYGTAGNGGSSGNGTLFRVNTDGTGFTNLHSFTAASGSLYTNSDGVNPVAGLILFGNTLYGTAYFGGSSGNGTVFKINTDGLGFTTLHSFTERPAPAYRNSDGANPSAGLILSGNTLYGTAYAGGIHGAGTVFAVNIDGTGFTMLHSFISSVAYHPYAGLILSEKTLYGTTLSGGGLSGGGTVFSLSLPPLPQLTITRSVENIILTWPSDGAAFTLQSTTNVVSPAVWSPVSPGPVVVNGQNAVTNLVSCTQNFYRLSQ